LRKGLNNMNKVTPIKPNQQTQTYNTTDLGNAQRFVNICNDQMFYIWETGKFHYYNGSVWKCDNSNSKTSIIAEKTIKSIYAEASNATDKSDREMLADHATKSESARAVNAMISLAKPKLSKSIEAFDTEPMKLNCLNAVIDLETGRTFNHDKDDLFSKQVQAEYIPGADCPYFLDFLKLIFDGNKDIINFMQLAIGYSLTATTDERCLFILHGTGRNGKSTLTENLAYLMGNYATKTPAETLLAKRFDGIPNDIARLKGSRFVYATETEKGRRFAESKIKEMCGDRDTMTGRFLHKEYFEFVPVFKLWLSTNHLPTISGVDDAIWDRIRLIPFNVRIPNDKITPRREVDEILKSERPGILNWAIKGCLEWQRTGLISPPEVMRASKSYRDDSDLLKPFFEDNCIIKTQASVEKSKLYDAFSEWAEKSGERKISKKQFGSELKNRGFSEDRRSCAKSRKSIWKGITLKNGGIVIK